MCDIEGQKLARPLRAAAMAAMNGKSSRQVGKDKDMAALLWVYKWGWSSASVLDSFASPNRRGVAARLVKKGLLEKHAADGGGLKGVPVDILTLTQDGVAEVETSITEAELLPYPRRGDRLIIWRQVRHDLLSQRYTAIRMVEKKITDYQTPRMIAAKSDANTKQPDAVWVMEDGKKMAVELELSAKYDRDLDEFCHKVIWSLSDQGNYAFVGILSQSAAIRSRYKAKLTAGEKYNIWQKGNDGRYRIEKQKTVPDWVKGKILVIEVAL